MLFENASQFQKAKQTLLDNNRDIDKTARILKKSPLFSNLSEGEIICQLTELNEGLGDSIMNFLSGAFGGDVSKLKTVLTQMKEQELKFNKEEYEIYNEFYNLLQDQKALDKDKENPNYQSLNRDLQQARNSLNVRMKELTKTHNEIFNALEEKVKDLTKDSTRKKKYFNAQRATDVLETRNDRYNKIKAITSKSSTRTQDLEDFFNVKVDDVKKESEEAKRKAEYEVEKLKKTSTEGPDPRSEDNPEKEYRKKFDLIKSTDAKYLTRRKAIFDLETDIYNLMMKNNATATKENPHGDLGEENRSKLYNLYNEIEEYLEKIEKGEKSNI
jgi:hypothetical protein